MARSAVTDLLLAGAAGALAGMAIANARAARAAERRNPPEGRFVALAGLDIHVREVGQGRPVLLLHGNGATADDWIVSGVPARLASHFRLVIPDRPGFGHTARPPRQRWDIPRQADLMARLARRLGMDRPIVVGHSLGATLALALALRHPDRVGGLVLVSGYYRRRQIARLLLGSLPAFPALGPFLAGTVLPVAAERAETLILRLLFAPRPVPAAFLDFPVGLALRPSQLEATAEDTAALLAAASFAHPLAHRLPFPVTILAGEGDCVIDSARQARDLSRVIPHARLEIVPATGHMLHHEEPDRVAAAVDEMEQAGAWRR